MIAAAVATASTSAPASASAPSRRATARTLGLLAVAALAARLVALAATGPERLRPDEAHFLNVARCFERGQGFSNVEAWPAWLAPASLPTPETFKEPGYPFLIAAFTPKGGDLYRTALGLALLAGVAVPLVLYALARRVDPDPRVATLAGLLAAGSPLLVTMSVATLVETWFALVVTALFLVALPAAARRTRPLGLDLLAGALFGFAYLLRAQVTLALPAVLLLLCLGRSRAAAARGIGLGVLAALAVMSPLILRNLRLFGVPFFSNVTSYGLWPYVDQIQFSHGLEHPPAPLGFALGHVPAIARHWAGSFLRFVRLNLPEDVLGNPIWVVAFAVGLPLALARWRSAGFAPLYLVATLGFIFAVHWASYYFTSLTPCVCLITALGGLWFWRALRDRPIAGPLRGRHVMIAAVVVALGGQVVAARRDTLSVGSLELEAARHETSFLDERLRPDEAVMVLITSYWAWYADRPAVHLVIADEPRFDEVLTRLRVRYAALPTSRLPELAARYPGGRLPASLVPDHEVPALDLSVFRVRGPSRTP